MSVINNISNKSIDVNTQTSAKEATNTKSSNSEACFGAFESKFKARGRVDTCSFSSKEQTNNNTGTGTKTNTYKGPDYGKIAADFDKGLKAGASAITETVVAGSKLPDSGSSDVKSFSLTSYDIDTNALTNVNNAIETWGDTTNTSDELSFNENRTDENWNNLGTTGSKAISVGNDIKGKIQTSEQEIKTKQSEASQQTTDTKAQEKDAVKTEETANNGLKAAEEQGEQQVDKAEEKKGELQEQQNEAESQNEERLTSAKEQFQKATDARKGLEKQLSEGNFDSQINDLESQLRANCNAKEGEGLSTEEKSNIQKKIDGLKQEKASLEKQLGEAKKLEAEAEQGVKDTEAESLKSTRKFEALADNADAEIKNVEKNANKAVDKMKAQAEQATKNVTKAHDNAKSAIESSKSFDSQVKAMQDYNKKAGEYAAQCVDRGNRALDLQRSSKPVTQGNDNPPMIGQKNSDDKIEVGEYKSFESTTRAEQNKWQSKDDAPAILEMSNTSANYRLEYAKKNGLSQEVTSDIKKDIAFITEELNGLNEETLAKTGSMTADPNGKTGVQMEADLKKTLTELCDFAKQNGIPFDQAKVDKVLAQKSGVASKPEVASDSGSSNSSVPTSDTSKKSGDSKIETKKNVSNAGQTVETKSTNKNTTIDTKVSKTTTGVNSSFRISDTEIYHDFQSGNGYRQITQSLKEGKDATYIAPDGTVYSVPYKDRNIAKSAIDLAIKADLTERYNKGIPLKMIEEN